MIFAIDRVGHLVYNPQTMARKPKKPVEPNVPPEIMEMLAECPFTGFGKCRVERCGFSVRRTPEDKLENCGIRFVIFDAVERSIRNSAGSAAAQISAPPSGTDNFLDTALALRELKTAVEKLAALGRMRGMTQADRVHYESLRDLVCSWLRDIYEVS
jgi:hypothetical protein